MLKCGVACLRNINYTFYKCHSGVTDLMYSVTGVVHRVELLQVVSGMTDSPQRLKHVLQSRVSSFHCQFFRAGDIWAHRYRRER